MHLIDFALDDFQLQGIAGIFNVLDHAADFIDCLIDRLGMFLQYITGSECDGSGKIPGTDLFQVLFNPVDGAGYFVGQ